MLWESEEKISGVEAVAGIINGMVGSLVLLLPVYALNAGYLPSLLAIALTGLSCAFSSWIYLQHLGEEPDIGHALMKHFRGSLPAKLLYDLAAWAFLVLACLEYFQLVVIQWECVVEATNGGTAHLASCAANGVLMLALVLLLKYWECGATTMVYGIVSIAIYLAYLVWVLVSESRTGASPSAFRPFVSVGGTVGLTAAMAQGFMIQVFLVPFLQKMKEGKGRGEKEGRFWSVTAVSYLIGGLVYEFIAEVGGAGIGRRTAMWPAGVFGILAYIPSSWELSCLCVVYTLHIYSVFPEYLLISKRIFFEALEKAGLQETSRRSINLQEVVYITAVVAAGAVLAAIKFPLEYLMMINGGILGALIIYIIPAFLHAYCMLCIPLRLRHPFDAPSDPPTLSNSRTSEIEISSFRSQSKTTQIQEPKSSMEALSADLLSREESRIEHSYVQCECDHFQRPLWFKLLTGALLGLMASLGIFVMVSSVRGAFSE